MKELEADVRIIDGELLIRANAFTREAADAIIRMIEDCKPFLQTAEPQDETTEQPSS